MIRIESNIYKKFYIIFINSFSFKNSSCYCTNKRNLRQKVEFKRKGKRTKFNSFIYNVYLLSFDYNSWEGVRESDSIFVYLKILLW